MAMILGQGKKTGNRLWLAVGVLALALAGCTTANFNGNSWFEGEKKTAAKAPPAKPNTTATKSASATASKAPPTRSTPAQANIVAAMLLPLSGKDAALGAAMQQSAEFALFDGRARNLSLNFYDTGDNPTTASRAMAQALKNDPKPVVILGPLYSSSVSAIQDAARTANIPVVSFSNNPAVANRNTYVLGFGPDAMMGSVVRFASAQGIRDIKAIGRSDAYGQKLAELLQAEGRRGGLLVSQVELYGGNGVSLAEAVGKLKPSPGVARSAVMLFDSGAELQNVTRQIQLQADWPATKFQLLGTQDWALDDLASNPVLQGAWYPAPDLEKRQAFERRYQGVYGIPPPALASLAYDSVALAGKLAELAPQDSRATNALLTEPAGYVGLSGLFRLDANGLSQRGYAIMQVASPSPRLIAAPPTSFAPTPQF